MKHGINFFFLHFIIFSFKFILSFSPNKTYNSYCPNYSLLQFSNIFSKANSISLSIWTKEYIVSNISKFFSDIPYFITTTKTGNISIISQKKILFSIDLNKKMYQTEYKTNLKLENITHEENLILPMEGKLFKTNLETENSGEFTTPIKDLVDSTPFSMPFCRNYYFAGNKSYSLIEIINKDNNNNNKFNKNINLEKIILVDYNLNCEKDKIQFWDTIVTNILFFDKNENYYLIGNNKKMNIDENILIYENYDILEKYMKEYFGNDYNDFLYIHGYDKEKKKYIKLYDFNTYIHIMQNNTIDNNFEEQYINDFLNNNDNNIINEFDYNKKIIYHELDLIIYYCIVSFIILWAIIIILNNFLFKFFFSIKTGLKKIFTKKSKNKISKINTENIIKENEIPYNEIFTNIKNYFKPNTTNKNSPKNEINKMRILLQKDIKSIKIKDDSFNLRYFEKKFTKNFESEFKEKSMIEKKKELWIYQAKKISEFRPKTRLEKDFKEITFIKKSIFHNSIDVILKAKHKIDEQIYAIKIKKLTNPNEEQSIIAEAQNMKKIRSKHIVEYITCWLDSSVGGFDYLFDDDNKIIDRKKEIKEIEEISEDTKDDIFFSSKNNSKISEIDINIKTKLSNEVKNDHYIKQLYTREVLSDDECTKNKKKKINIDNIYYQKKDIKEENTITNNNKDHHHQNKKIKLKDQNSYIDDSSIIKKKSQNQKNISDLSIYFFIQMEFCQQMTLSQYIQDHSISKINNKVMYTFTYQLIKSLAKIHAKNIIHANINPENIFVINEDSIKIGDFSSAKDIELTFKKRTNKDNTKPQSQSYKNIMEFYNKDEIQTGFAEESLYSSPEQKKGNGISKKSDIYSVGLVLYEMCKCYSDEDKRNKGIKHLKKHKILDDKFKRDYGLQSNLILQMIEDDEDKRPSCLELLEDKDMQNWKFIVNEN